jgi:quinone-modifying oxidoreductase, subunit QmoC
MTVRVNPRLIEDLKHFGAEDVSKCYHCGNCSAACPFSEEPFLFPRRAMRYLQMGAESSLRSSLTPWLCYYCGECSDQCPRGAEPGETMMSMRRWLTSKYDVTGISGWMYRSLFNQLLALAIVALVTLGGLLFYGFTYGGGSLSVYDGPGAFLPHHAVHMFDWGMGAVMFSLIGINILRMWHFIMRGQHARPVSLGAYIRHALLVPVHFFTQKRYSQCSHKQPWVMHMMIMLGYTTMLVLIVFFLGDIQEGPHIHWLHAFGYLATVGLIVGLTWALKGRLNKELTYQQKTHHSDWVFSGMLLFLAVTGIVQHILHRVGLPYAANIAYLVHLPAVFAFELTQGPFGKWSHLVYRPIAMYFAQLQKEAWAAEAEGYETVQVTPATAAAD